MWRCESGDIGDFLGTYTAVSDGGYDAIVDSRASDFLQQIVLGLGVQKRILAQQSVLKVPLRGARAIKLR